MTSTTSNSVEHKAEEIQTSRSKRGFFRSGLFKALCGSCGFGLQLGRIAGDYRQSRFEGIHIVLGLIFLAMAVQGSLHVLRERGADRC